VRGRPDTGVRPDVWVLALLQKKKAAAPCVAPASGGANTAPPV
jgi:hypothetical protein